MAHASTAAAESEILRSHDRLETLIGPYHYEIARTPEGTIYTARDATQSVSVPLAWAFGMGEVGQTYVYAQDGKWYESHMSYYTSIQGLDYSPGHQRTIPSSLGSALGRLFEIGEPRLCFGCHSTASTTRNQFDPSHQIPGVTCEACHGPGARHVAKMSLGVANQKSQSILNPAMAESRRLRRVLRCLSPDSLGCSAGGLERNLQSSLSALSPGDQSMLGKRG